MACGTKNCDQTCIMHVKKYFLHMSMAQLAQNKSYQDFYLLLYMPTVKDGGHNFCMIQNISRSQLLHNPATTGA